MASNSKGLGRGFETLIPQEFDSALLVDEQERIQKLFISTIVPNAQQPRTNFNEQLLQELAESIKQYGILQPIVVRVNDDGTHSIVAGERRWRAAQLAGMEQIPAIVRTMEELEQLEIALVENVQRVDLSPLEQAVSIHKLHDQFSIAYEEIARRLGKASSTVTNIVRLLQLPKEAQEALRDGLITEGHARAVLALKDTPQKQLLLLQFIIKNHWSVRQAEQFVVATKKDAKDTQAAKKQIQKTTPATEKLSKKFGTPVTIRRLAKGGKLEITFKTNQELDELVQRLNQAK